MIGPWDFYIWRLYADSNRDDIFRKDASCPLNDRVKLEAPPGVEPGLVA